jgi:hypothetical protein
LMQAVSVGRDHVAKATRMLDGNMLKNQNFQCLYSLFAKVMRSPGQVAAPLVRVRSS